MAKVMPGVCALTNRVRPSGLQQAPANSLPRKSPPPTCLPALAASVSVNWMLFLAR